MSNEADTSSPEYTFGRNINSSIRLNYQQYIWQSTFKYRLHPAIAIPDGAIIADVGCGTGLWLLELSQDLASKHVALTGFDIDLSQVPTSGTAGVSFKELDIMQPLPQHLEGKFDIVNLQFFSFILGTGGPRFELVLHNLAKMVKPGGWLQWAEVDRTRVRFLKANENSSTAGMEESFGGNIEDVRAKVGDWTSKLPEHFAAAGLTDTAVDERWTPPHLVGMMQLNFVAAHDELVTGLPEGNSYKAKLQANQSNLVRDMNSGGALDITMVLAVGRKPL